jgi:hypothetical protein
VPSDLFLTRETARTPRAKATIKLVRSHRCIVCVRGHEKVPAGGHVRSPLVAMKSPHWWPGEVLAPH